jgi:hypothetical protein
LSPNLNRYVFSAFFNCKRLAKDTSVLIPRFDKLISISSPESIYEKITSAMGRDH